MNKTLFIIASAGILFTSCKSKKKEEVVSKKHLHKFGYAMSETDWNEEQPPGQIFTTYRNGRTVTETYEDCLLHGEKTITFPHSQTVQTKEIYNKGILTKRLQYNIRGIPRKETTFKSPTHQIITTWHHTGPPESKEEYINGKLESGQYFSLLNETVSSIANGTGEKTVFNLSGNVVSKEVYVDHAIDYTETYHLNGTPDTITSFKNGKMHGEKKAFAPSGEPLFVENYADGLKHGLCTYFQNGFKYLETNYAEGRKDGLERQYIDGTTLSEETEYAADLKHGPSIVFFDGSSKTSWYFKDTKVSKNTFNQYVERDYLITSAQK
ncbi:hypothetical protein K0U07_03190 [bacterium]|nr:hypothetical protein [bacterium]